MAKQRLHRKGCGKPRMKDNSGPTSVRGQMAMAPKSKGSEFVCTTILEQNKDGNGGFLARRLGRPGSIVKIRDRKYMIAESGAFERIEG